MILAGGLIGASYAFLATPQYEVSAVLRPAAINDLDALNRSGIYQLSPADALLKVGASLESYDTRLAFFRANQNLFEKFVRPGQTLEQSFEAFNRNSIRLTVPGADKKGSLSAYVKLQMTYSKDIDGVAIVNGIVDYAIDDERKQIANDVNVIVKNRLNEIKGKLNSARANYYVNKEAKIATLREIDSVKRAQLQDELKALRIQLKALRNDRVNQLKEAIGIAKSLGIQKPTTPSAFGELVNARSGSMVRTEINNQQTPLYFMGVDALKSELSALELRQSDDFTDPRVSQIAKELQLLASNREIEILNARKNEDLFLADVQPLRAELARLSNLNTDMTGLKLVAVDQQALEPLASASPNRLLIIVLGLFAGLVLGIFILLSRFVFVANSSDARLVATDSSVPLLQPRAQGGAVLIDSAR
ncbi:LPS O-antigen subunit length determinant protein (WzzB/FepE family) [Pseudomonas sp. SJZ103]|nr:LPS O-antigen subunit length determinant protein (WzzB/FepE family) [Pseudomonas sp. SJZ103]TWC92555.1 LPS O-antigen subunit length determinant protein (WzzB/FepE family) [Pseudomonas sp. SJZ094]